MINYRNIHSIHISPDIKPKMNAYGGLDIRNRYEFPRNYAVNEYLYL